MCYFEFRVCSFKCENILFYKIFYFIKYLLIVVIKLCSKFEMVFLVIEGKISG